MLIDNNMNVGELAKIMTCRATEGQLRAFRDLLCLHHKGFETDQVPDRIWNLLLDVAMEEGK